MSEFTWVGRKIVLHSNMVPEREHDKPDEVFVIEVVEEKDVKNCWGEGTGKGLRAVSKDGREFYNNWESFADDSMSPRWMWDHHTGGKYEVFYDITQCLYGVIPLRPKFLDRPEISEVIDYCPVHKRLSNKDFSISLKEQWPHSCMYCYYKEEAKDYPYTMGGKTWNGWF